MARTEFGDKNGDGIAFTLSFPEMENVATRAFADSPQPENLDVFLFVFDGEDLLQTILIPTDYEGRKYEDGKIKFTAQLPQTDKNATIHIVAIDDESGDFAAQIDANGYGIEDSVIPALSVSDNTDCYWQRVPVGCPIKVGVDNKDNDLEDVPGTDEQVQAVFNKTIHLIRNFAKVTLSSEAPNFTVLAWTIVNERNSGSVAPWYSKSGSTDIQYAEYFYTEGGVEKETTYQKLTDDGYIGVSQSGAQLRNTLDKIGVYNDDNWKQVENNVPTTKYIYERRNVSVNPLYILIYGELHGASGSTERGYYKLALGHTDRVTGIFTPYNVLRNMAYNVTIDAVTGKGASTPNEAASGPASNNISGDVVTKNLTQISDGVDRLEVSFINYVVTTSGQYVDFRFKYTQNFTSSSSNIDNDAVTYKDSEIGIKDGDVIQRFREIKEGDEEYDPKYSDWKTIRIYFNNPTEVLKQQSFTLYSKPDYAGDGSLPETNTLGLSRTINLVLREPWDFIRMETYPGNWVDDDQFPDWDPDTSDDEERNLVGPDKGDPLTVFFELPAGLPEAIFPLECTFESDRQNIENDGKGTAVVQTGPSLFEGVLDHRISYTKTVTWQDYAPDGESSTVRSRIQRARFVTTTNISSLVGTNYISTIRLHNPYFNDKDDKFERDQNQTVTPTPSNSVRTEKTITTKTETTAEFNVVWNFTNDSWNEPASMVSSNDFTRSIAGNESSITRHEITTITTYVKITKTVGTEVTVNEDTDTQIVERDYTDTYMLTIANGTNTNNYKLTTGTDDGRYFCTNRTNNSFILESLNIAVPNDGFTTVTEELTDTELKVTAAANVNGQTPYPNITLGDGLSVPDINQTYGTKQYRTYQISINQNNKGKDKTITFQQRQNVNNSKIKFYEFALSGKYHKVVTKTENSDETITSD